MPAEIDVRRRVTVLGRILAPQWRQIEDPPQYRHTLFDGVREVML